MTRAFDPSTERLWNLLSGKLLHYFGRQVKDAALADDLLQEAFVRIQGGLAGLGDEQRIEPWVFRIARNLVIDHRRSERPSDSTDGEPRQVEASGRSDEGNFNTVVSGWLPEMIDRLPEPYAYALRLHELEGLRQREIAERLGLSLSGTKSRIQRGRERLRAMLFECCSFELDGRGNVIGITPRRPDDCEDCDAPADCGS